MFNHHASDTQSKLTDLLTAYSEASVDPAFDAELDDLEYQLEQFRLASNQD